MKKVIFLALFAICTISVSAQTTDPAILKKNDKGSVFALVAALCPYVMASTIMKKDTNKIIYHNQPQPPYQGGSNPDGSNRPIPNDIWNQPQPVITVTYPQDTATVINEQFIREFKGNTYTIKVEEFPFNRKKNRVVITKQSIVKFEREGNCYLVIVNNTVYLPPSNQPQPQWQPQQMQMMVFGIASDAKNIRILHSEDGNSLVLLYNSKDQIKRIEFN